MDGDDPLDGLGGFVEEVAGNDGYDADFAAALFDHEAATHELGESLRGVGEPDSFHDSRVDGTQVGEGPEEFPVLGGLVGKQLLGQVGEEERGRAGAEVGGPTGGDGLEGQPGRDRPAGGQGVDVTRWALRDPEPGGEVVDLLGGERQVLRPEVEHVTGGPEAGEADRGLGAPGEHHRQRAGRMAHEGVEEERALAACEGVDVVEHDHERSGEVAAERADEAGCERLGPLGVDPPDVGPRRGVGCSSPPRGHPQADRLGNPPSECGEGAVRRGAHQHGHRRGRRPLLDECRLPEPGTGDDRRAAGGGDDGQERVESRSVDDDFGPPVPRFVQRRNLRGRRLPVRRLDLTDGARPEERHHPIGGLERGDLPGAHPFDAAAQLTVGDEPGEAEDHRFHVVASVVGPPRIDRSCHIPVWES